MQKRTLIIPPDEKIYIEFADKQMKILWFPEEITLEKDVQDILVNMTEAERHGVTTTLKLFTLYEDVAGNEYWGDRFKQMNSSSIALTRMASVFSMFESAIHLPFYQKINELLYVHTDEFYSSYVEDPTLKARMEFIDSAVSSKNDLESLAVFSMVEGAILYSSFAFLKHFQSKGKNKLLNVVRGINFSVRDENLHSEAGAYIFKKKLASKNYSEEELQSLKETIYKAARDLYEHECRIVDMIFEKGSIEGITETQMKHFVMSRVNLCLYNLGYDPLEKISYDPISSWFYDGINGFQYNDFFSGIGNQYSRMWNEEGFIW